MPILGLVAGATTFLTSDAGQSVLGSINPFDKVAPTSTCPGAPSEATVEEIWRRYPNSKRELSDNIHGRDKWSSRQSWSARRFLENDYCGSHDGINTDRDRRVRRFFDEWLAKYGGIAGNAVVPAGAYPPAQSVNPLAQAGRDTLSAIIGANQEIVDAAVRGAATGAQTAAEGARAGASSGNFLANVHPLVLLGGAGLVMFAVMRNS